MNTDDAELFKKVVQDTYKNMTAEEKITNIKWKQIIHTATRELHATLTTVKIQDKELCHKTSVAIIYQILLQYSDSVDESLVWLKEVKRELVVLDGKLNKMER